MKMKSLLLPFRRKPESLPAKAGILAKRNKCRLRRMRLSPQRFRLSPEWKIKTELFPRRLQKQIQRRPHAFGGRPADSGESDGGAVVGGRTQKRQPQSEIYRAVKLHCFNHRQSLVVKHRQKSVYAKYFFACASIAGAKAAIIKTAIAILNTRRRIGLPRKKPPTPAPKIPQKK